ncbi:MAG: hypothetical protein AAF629_20120 [Chloroflexota bacterium]
MRIFEPTLFGIYWFFGGYFGGSLTPWALQFGLIMLIIGLVLYIKVIA